MNLQKNHSGSLEYYGENVWVTTGYYNIVVDLINWAYTLEEIPPVVYGYTDVLLQGDYNATSTQETNLGSLTAHANLWYAQQYDASVRGAIKNGGGIVSTLYPGEIYQNDIQNVLPYNNKLTIATLTAQELKDVIEHAIQYVPSSGPFPQIAGFRFEYDLNAPVGNRVKYLAITDSSGIEDQDILVENYVVSPDAINVRMVILDYLYNGGAGYPLTSLSDPRAETMDTVEFTDTQHAVFAGLGTEQDAFVEFIAEFYGETGFAVGETPSFSDLKIRNTGSGTVYSGNITGNTTFYVDFSCVTQIGNWRIP